MDHFDGPRRGDNDRKGVGEHHFVVFKQFVVNRCQDKRHEDEEEEK